MSGLVTIRSMSENYEYHNKIKSSTFWILKPNYYLNTVEFKFKICKIYSLDAVKYKKLFAKSGLFMTSSNSELSGDSW